MIELRRRYSGLGGGSDAPSFSRLPAGYQEVEYLMSTGTQYIDIGYNPDNGLEFDITYRWNTSNLSDESAIFGTSHGESNHIVLQYHKNAVRFYKNDATQSVIYNYQYNVITNVKVQGGYFYLDGTELENISPILYNPNNIYIFGRNIDGKASPSPIDIFSAKFSVNGKLVRNLIPCYRTSDRKPGMYDIVNDVFYTNAGTGEFLVGQDVHYNIPPEYQQVEYLEDSGTQYIELPIYKGFKGSIKAKFEFPYIANNLFQFRFALGWSEGAQVGLVRISDMIRKWHNYNTSDTVAEYNKIYNTMLAIDANKSELYVDGALVVSNTVFNNTLPLTLYRLSTATQYKNPLWGKIYEILVEGSTNMHLIPCYRKSDNVAGMYDLVSGEFYINAGTGEFIVGPDVN